MKAIIRYLFVIVLIILPITTTAQQRIGLVLSGGGATGLAHIGVLKALEEHGIPIDYITGTSAGALVGALYAAGYSPDEILLLATNEAFQKMSTGKLEPSQRFTYRESHENASMFNYGIGMDNAFANNLPTHYRSSAYLDYALLNYLAPASQAANNNYDSLFVPFRCVASDITQKESVVFAKGNLNQSVRASMTYPFYFEAIEIDNVLYFDGGLYNNFPADVMYHNFDVDFIIGSNVSSGNAAPPDKNNLISQLTNMLMSPSDFTIPCQDGILIEPKINSSTFDFEDAEKIIQQGYYQTLRYIDSIAPHIQNRVPIEEIRAKREAFRKRIIPIRISSVEAINRNGKNMIFAEKSMLKHRKAEIISARTFERRYFRLNATPQVGFMFPTLDQKTDSTYQLNLTVNKAKDFNVEIGGLFTTRPVNTGFVGLGYNFLGRFASKIYGNTYFGKFYTSAKGEVTFDFPSTFPVNLSTYIILNKFDYFRNFANFFAPEVPSYLVSNEVFTGIDFKHPISNSTKSTIQARYFHLEDRYYQNKSFNNTDTTDITTFQGTTVAWEFLQNTLNRKQFASSGHYFSLKARYVIGYEHSVAGSTAPLPFDDRKLHQWINLSADFKTFVIDFKKFHMGIHGTAVFNSQSLFSNYTASVLAMTAYAPLSDMETYFMPTYRSPQYVGAGTNMILSFTKSLDLRADLYYYQPFRSIIQNHDGTFGYAKPFKGESFIASGSFIYHSPLGPVRATVNYFPKISNPWSFQFTFGYILFNQRAIR